MKEMHLLERAEAKTSKSTERNCTSRGNSLAGEGRGQNWSEHINKGSRKHSQPEVRTSQVTEGKKAKEGHSLPEGGRGQDWSKY